MLIGPGDFSYSGDPDTSLKDQVRFLIGDTEVDDMILTDAEIEWTINRRGRTTNIYYAASDAADLAGHKYSRIINRQTGTLTLSLSSNNIFHERAKTLRQLAADVSMGPVVANNALQSLISANGGRRRPLFWLGMHDYYPNDADHDPSEYGGGYPYPSTSTGIV